MDAIHQWLQSTQNFNEGVSLYATYGDNEFLKKLFQSGPDAYNKQKLVEVLKKLIEKTIAPLKEIKNEFPKSQPISTQEDHAKYIALCRKRDDIYLQINRNMFLLDHSTNENVLHETAKQILRLQQNKTEVWALIDFYQEHGCFEIVQPKKEKRKSEQIQLLHQAISKAKTRLKNPDYKNKSKTKALLAKHLERLTELKQQP